MEIYDVLKKDHETVRGLLAQLLSLGEQEEEQRHELVSQIRDALIPHARAEESVFYNSLRTVESAKDMTMHAFREHLEAEAVLRLLQLEDKTNMDWRETAQKLKTSLEHHIQEEEGLMFEKARNHFTSEEAQMMATAFEKMKPEIKEQGLAGTTWEMLANLMPPRFTDSFRKSSGSGM